MKQGRGAYSRLQSAYFHSEPLRSCHNLCRPEQRLLSLNLQGSALYRHKFPMEGTLHGILKQAGIDKNEL